MQSALTTGGQTCAIGGLQEISNCVCSSMFPENKYDRGAITALGMAFLTIVLIVVLQVPHAPLDGGGHIAQIERSENTYPFYSEQSTQVTNPWEDTYAQWIMAVFSVLATAASIWAVLLLRQTLQATRDAVRAADEAVLETRRIGEAQTRAYLSPTIEFVPMLDGDTLERNAVFDLSLTNKGQSPARRLKITLASGWQPKTLPNPCPDLIRLRETHTASSYVLASGETSQSRLRNSGLTYLEVYADTPQREHNDPYVFGVVRYEDVFGKRHKTRFCWRIIGAIDTEHVPEVGEQVPIRIEFETANSHNDELEID